MTKQRIFVAGHRGMVGSAIVRQLEQRGDVEVVVRTRDELNLLDSRAVQDFFANERIDQVYLAAAKVGGIVANNTYPADFIYENMMIESNIIHAAHLHNVNKLLFLGSSCIYPKMAKQPIAESELLQGTLEATNEPYAIAKIAGIKLCESYNRQYNRDYRSVMPTNLYGPHDNFHPSNSHVIPALLRRFWPYMARYKGILCFDLFCAAITSVCELVLPLIMRSITNMGVNDLSSLTVSYILRVGALYLVLRLIDGAANYFMANTGHVMGARIETDMRRDAFDHLQKLSDSYFANTKVGLSQ